MFGCDNLSTTLAPLGIVVAGAGGGAHKCNGTTVMSCPWRAAAVILGVATQACVAFVPAVLGRASIKLATDANSAAVCLRSHVGRTSLRRQGRYADPLMMAKERKKGKGKAGRVELIERYGREGNEEDVFLELDLQFRGVQQYPSEVQHGAPKHGVTSVAPVV